MAKSYKKSTAELFMDRPADPQGTPAPEGLVIPKGYKLIKEYKSERMQLLLRPAIKEAIKAEAAAQGISANELANTIFEEYLKGKGKL